MRVSPLSSSVAVLTIATGLAPWLLYAWTPWGDSAVQRYRVATVTRGDVISSVSASGTLNPVSVISLGTQVSGKISALYADFNDEVQAGQLLAELDATAYQAAVDQTSASLTSARASMTLAERDTSRFADLYEHGLVSKQTLDEVVQRLTIARAARAVLDAQMQRDLSNLSYTKIFAPVAGVVLSREVAVGQTVAASFQTPELFKIAEDLSKIHIECSIPEIDIGAVKVGQRVEFTVDAFPQKRFSGRTRQVRIDPSISEGIVSYSVIVDVSNSGRELLPGMTAQVEIILDEHRHVLRVPNAAVMFAKERGRVSGQDAGNKSVYIPDGHDDVVAIPVRLGLVGIEYTEILDGTLGLASVVVVGDQQSTSDD